MNNRQVFEGAKQQKKCTRCNRVTDEQLKVVLWTPNNHGHHNARYGSVKGLHLTQQLINQILISLRLTCVDIDECT